MIIQYFKSFPGTDRYSRLRLCTLKINKRKEVKKEGICLWRCRDRFTLWDDFIPYILIKKSGKYMMFVQVNKTQKWYKITPDTMYSVEPVPKELYKQHFFDTLK